MSARLYHGVGGRFPTRHSGMVPINMHWRYPAFVGYFTQTSKVSPQLISCYLALRPFGLPEVGARDVVDAALWWAGAGHRLRGTGEPVGVARHRGFGSSPHYSQVNVTGRGLRVGITSGYTKTPLTGTVKGATSVKL